MAKEGALFGMGNPLLDISTRVGPGYLKKYDLQSNNAILAEDKHIPIYKELVDMYEVEYVAGGSTQSTIKVAQWMSGKPHMSTFIGCIGKDEFGEKLKENLEGHGVRTSYYKDEKEATGTCAVLINGKNRSLCANLAAANCYKFQHLQQPENWALVEQANYYYIAGFFLTVSPESILAIGKHSYENKKCFMMNLSAPYVNKFFTVPLEDLMKSRGAPFISQFFMDPLMKAMQFVDILFGNETEALTFAEQQNFGTKDLTEIGKKIANLDKADKSRPRMVVITQGADPTIIVKADYEESEYAEKRCKFDSNGGGDQVSTYPVLPIQPEDILDTNGAGDAFVGGFLCGLVQGKSTEDCVKSGNWAANLIIQRSGCTFPEVCEYKG